MDQGRASEVCNSMARMRTDWHARVRTWAMLLFLVTLKNFDVCTGLETAHAHPKNRVQPVFGGEIM